MKCSFSLFSIYVPIKIFTRLENGTAAMHKRKRRHLLKYSSKMKEKRAAFKAGHYVNQQSSDKIFTSAFQNITKEMWKSVKDEFRHKWIWEKEFRLPSTSRLTIYRITDKFETTSSVGNAPVWTTTKDVEAGKSDEGSLYFRKQSKEVHVSSVLVAMYLKDIITKFDAPSAIPPQSVAWPS
ncbi:hypothetical protein TNIN_276761 [Trichonephila inaurata madagascariensis]|uniref:Uncharacterized protein n=1 Tax=Trichonephila inaurata madagascariensis TaxID=2747483 RepID=A0A8X6KM96_9ARAC|nr:hypothetical protein TNIN_276761 [Trichonephila inaurata madagascariensis]